MLIAAQSRKVCCTPSEPHDATPASPPADSMLLMVKLTVPVCGFGVPKKFDWGTDENAKSVEAGAAAQSPAEVSHRLNAEHGVPVSVAFHVPVNMLLQFGVCVVASL